MPDMDLLYYASALRQLAARQHWPEVVSATRLLIGAIESDNLPEQHTALALLDAALAGPRPGTVQADQSARQLHHQIVALTGAPSAAGG